MNKVNIVGEKKSAALLAPRVFPEHTAISPDPKRKRNVKAARKGKKLIEKVTKSVVKKASPIIKKLSPKRSLTLE